MAVVKTELTFKSSKNTTGTTRAAPAAIANSAVFQAAVAMTRPTNTTAYAAGDMIGRADASTPGNAGDAIMEFTEIGPKGGAVRIAAVDLMVAQAANTGMGNFTLHLYNAAPAAKLDNAAFDLEAADRTKYLGSVLIGTPADLGATQYAENADLKGKIVKLAAESTSLWGVLAGAGTDTPTSGGVYTTKLTTQQAH
ncbi:MAG: hypothetical protein LCH79_16115 [Proteobacteria bacterium]|nr:hypothetical protein [Pseudomonadota bacterium]